MTDTRNRTPRWLHALPVIYLLAGFAWILGSDLVVGWLYQDDVRSLVYANILKGLLFVFLTATLLYVILGVRRADSTAGLRRRESFELRRPLAAFALVGLGIAAAGYLVYLLEADGIRDRAAQELQASARRSAAELSAWHDGRVRSILQIADNQLTLRFLKQWQHNPSDPQRELLREQLEFVRVSQGYTAVAAFTRDGAPLVAVGRPIVVTAEVRRSLRDAVAVGRVVSSWITIDGVHRGRQPALDLVVPLHERHGVDSRPAALIVARTAVTLPPSAVPASAATQNLDVALARPDGVEIGVLQRSSRSGLVGYTLLPRMRNDLAVVQVMLGERGTATALDTEDRTVVATGYPVGATPWKAIAAIDLASIEQQIQRLMLLIACLSALGFLATAGLVLPWWRRLSAGAGAQIKRAELRAEEMAARLGWVTRYANDVILLMSLDGKILDANDRAEELYGYSRDELLALSVIDLKPTSPSQAALAQAQFKTVQRGGSLVFEATHVNRNGAEIPVEVSSRQVTHGNQRYVQSIIRDISDRRRTEEELRRSEAQYRLLFRANPHVMWVYEIESRRFLAVNNAAIEHYGYTEPEFLEMTVGDIRPDVDRARLEAHINAHGSEDLRHSGFWRHRKKDGTLIDVEITSHNVVFRDRAARLVMATDVTSRLRTERALTASERRYRSLFENASDGILVVGPDQRVITANAEYQAMLGYSLAELVGTGLQPLLDECEHVRLDSAAASLRGSRSSAPATWIHRRKDGSRFTAEVRARMLPGGDALVTVRNLTEILAARRRIERQRDLYDLLSQCNQAIIKFSDKQVLLHEVARLAVVRGRFLFAWVGEIAKSGDVVPVVMHGDDSGYATELHLNVNDLAPGGAGPAGKGTADRATGHRQRLPERRRPGPLARTSTRAALVRWLRFQSRLMAGRPQC
ncbi:MAG: PAS domain S-box protein [Proteobacteria bacterium]|nr:PAS domain S-box protein [Pseudomonadota bacterium]